MWSEVFDEPPFVEFREVFHLFVYYTEHSFVPGPEGLFSGKVEEVFRKGPDGVNRVSRPEFLP